MARTIKPGGPNDDTQSAATGPETQPTETRALETQPAETQPSEAGAADTPDVSLELTGPESSPETFRVSNVSATLLTLSDGTPFPSRSRMELTLAEIERFQAMERERNEVFISVR